MLRCCVKCTSFLMDSDKVRLPMRRYVIVFSLIVSMWGLGHWNTDAAIKLMRLAGCCDIVVIMQWNAALPVNVTNITSTCCAKLNLLNLSEMTQCFKKGNWIFSTVFSFLCVVSENTGDWVWTGMEGRIRVAAPWGYLTYCAAVWSNLIRNL